MAAWGPECDHGLSKGSGQHREDLASGPRSALHGQRWYRALSDDKELVLSQIGMRQHLELGQLLKKRFQGFLSPVYKQEEVKLAI